jgi:hypothetical protein
MSVTIKVILFMVFFLVLCEEAKGSDCYSNFGCYGSNVCCKPNDLNYVCRANCIGKSCVSNSDCGGANEYCCDYECQEGLCVLAGWIIAIIVLSVLGGIGTILGVVLCFYCAHRRRSPGVILTTQPAVTMPVTTVVAGSSHVNYPHGYVYPAAQQPMPGYGPPPAYHQPPQTQPQK